MMESHFTQFGEKLHRYNQKINIVDKLTRNVKGYTSCFDICGSCSETQIAGSSIQFCFNDSISSVPIKLYLLQTIKKLQNYCILWTTFEVCKWFIQFSEFFENRNIFWRNSVSIFLCLKRKTLMHTIKVIIMIIIFCSVDSGNEY